MSSELVTHVAWAAYTSAAATLITVDALNAARSRHTWDKVHFARMDAGHLGLPCESFDTVNASASLHHLADVPQALAEMVRVLRPGGRLILTEMHSDGRTPGQMVTVSLHQWIAAVDAALDIHHYCTLGRQEILDQVAALGLREVACYDFSDTQSDPLDKESFEQMRALIDTTIERTRTTGDAEALELRGTHLRQRLEVFLLYLLGIGVGANGIGGFSGHLFASDQVAEAIGWPAGNPFQLEVGFSNLAIGILGVIAIHRRDGLREATVIAATTFSVGATIVHVIDIVATGNLAPGNTIQNVGNLVRPALLIGFLIASRRADKGGEPELRPVEFERWRRLQTSWADWITGGVAMGFGIGLALEQGLLSALLGVAGGAAVAWITHAAHSRSAS